MAMFNRDTIVAAHKHCSRHRDEVLKSTICGCFYCKATFIPADISDWVDDGGIEDFPELESSSAICPKCGIDAVIGSTSGYPVTDKTFLQEMYQFWF